VGVKVQLEVCVSPKSAHRYNQGMDENPYQPSKIAEPVPASKRQFSSNRHTINLIFLLILLGIFGALAVAAYLGRIQ